MSNQKFIYALAICFLCISATTTNADNLIIVEDSLFTVSGKMNFNISKSSMPDRVNDTKQNLLSFSSHYKDDFLNLTIEINNKVITLKKGYVTKNKELHVTANHSSSKDFLSLDAFDKKKIEKLSAELRKELPENFMNSRLFSQTCYLSSWPVGLPLELEMTTTKIRVGNDVIDRQKYEESKQKAALELMRSELSATTAYSSICEDIGSYKLACFPKQLFPYPDAQCEYVRVGGSDCMGRCGSRCSGLCSGTKYTEDCLNHDACVNRYHLTHRYCNFIFSYCSDDCFRAPDCY